MSGLMAKLYHGVFKRTSTFVLAVGAGTFFFERSFDMISDHIFETVNHGKLWHHIKDKYE